MRTTIRLDDQLLTEVKRLALESGRTLTAVVEDALRELVVRRKVAQEVKKTRLVSDGGNGLRPGVCLDDNAALRDAMEGTSGASR
jgi:Arc/MetJ family transcription regulator